MHTQDKVTQKGGVTDYKSHVADKRKLANQSITGPRLNPSSSIYNHACTILK